MYSTSDLTFVVQAQNYIKWEGFSTNHLLQYRVTSGNCNKKNELQGW